MYGLKNLCKSCDCILHIKLFCTMGKALKMFTDYWAGQIKNTSKIILYVER